MIKENTVLVKGSSDPYVDVTSLRNSKTDSMYKYVLKYDRYHYSHVIPERMIKEYGIIYGQDLPLNVEEKIKKDVLSRISYDIFNMLDKTVGYDTYGNIEIIYHLQVLKDDEREVLNLEIQNLKNNIINKQTELDTYKSELEEHQVKTIESLRQSLKELDYYKSMTLWDKIKLIFKRNKKDNYESDNRIE